MDAESADGSLALDYTTLQHKNQRLEHILQIIYLSGIIEEVPLQKRLTILIPLHEQFEQCSVHELYEALNVFRGTFYNHIFRKAKADRARYLRVASPNSARQADLR